MKESEFLNFCFIKNINTGILFKYIILGDYRTRIYDGCVWNNNHMVKQCLQKSSNEVKAHNSHQILFNIFFSKHQSTKIMFTKLVIAFLMVSLSRADQMAPWSACPLDPPVDPMSNITCEVPLTCTWPIENDEVETCTCEGQGLLQCIAMLPPLFVNTVSTCPETSPINATDVESSITVTICDTPLECTWPLDIANGVGTQTCKCEANGEFKDCTMQAVDVPIYRVSECPDTPPSYNNTSSTLICDKPLSCSWDISGEDWVGGETCTCEAAGDGFTQCISFANPAVFVTECPPAVIFPAAVDPIPVCTNMSLSCDYERVVETPDAVGGYSCSCNDEKVFTCYIWEALAATAAPDDSAASTVGGLGMGKASKKSKKTKKSVGGKKNGKHIRGRAV